MLIDPLIAATRLSRVKKSIETVFFVVKVLRMVGGTTDNPRVPGEAASESGVSARALEPIAMVALDAGRMMMEAGASARNIDLIVSRFALGLGADRVDLRIGYASLAITIVIGPSGITRMRRVGNLGVNQRLDQELWRLAERVSRRELTLEQTSRELSRLARETPRHSPLVTAVAVGLACAAFARLLGVDWAGTGAVLVAAAFGQLVRHGLLSQKLNSFICTALVSVLTSLLAGLGARWAGSEAVTGAMVAAILLLVPGVPAVNAQSDILDGHPTLGSARAVTVVMTLIFVAAGLWVGQLLLSHWP